MSIRRWAEIDNLYAIGIILVVLGHSHSSDWSTFSGTVLNPMIIFIYTFHMPLFFFIAGFLFMNSHSLERMGYGCWLKQKAERLLIPYVILSVIALIPKYYVENRGFSGFTWSYLAKTVFVPRMGVWGHFWFLPVLLLLYIVFGVCKKLLNGKNDQLVLAVMVQISVVLYFMPYGTEWFGLSDFMKAMPFYTTGIIVNRFLRYCKRMNSVGFRVIWILSGLTISIALLYWFNDIKIVMLLIALIMISVCWQVAVLIGENRVCRWVSSHNFIMYIYSWPFQAVAMVIASRQGFSWYMTTLVMFITGITVPICMVFVYKKLKRLNNRFFEEGNQYDK